MRQRLLGQVRARLEKFATSRDPAALLDSDTVAEVNALLGTAGDPSTDLEIALAAGWVHWMRCQVLPDGEREEDLTAALRLFAPVYKTRPGAVPDQVRAVFDEHWPDAASSPATRAERAAVLLDETMRTGDPSALDAAIDMLREAVDATPADYANRVGWLSNLCAALRIRFERAGRSADLDAAIDAGQGAVDTAPSSDPNRAVYLSNHGDALRVRFDRAGQLADLDGEIDAYQGAVDAAPADHPDRVTYLCDLGGARHIRFDRAGQLADLNVAIDAYQAALHADPPSRTAVLSLLGDALQSRFRRTGQLADLDAEIDARRSVLDATPPDHPERAVTLSGLDAALQRRYERSWRPADLDAAIDACQGAVDATPLGHPKRARYLANLGAALLRRSQRDGLPTDLDAAITHSQAAVDAAPRDDLNRAMYLSNLGGALQHQFERGGQPADIDAAVAACQAAVDTTPPDHPNRTGYLTNLGAALMRRFERGGRPADLAAAIDAYRRGVDVVGASPLTRARAALGWGRAAADAGRWTDAAVGFAKAVELLGQVAPRSLARGDQEHLLAELSGVGADAAVCCVRAGLVERAVELFEQGRGVLLGQALDTRTDLTLLADQHPDLAASFLLLRDVLDRPGDTARGRPGPDDSAADPDRRAAGIAFEALIASIRGLDGFETFLRPPSVDDLLATAAHGPIVAVAVSPFGSYALLLTRDGVQALELPRLTRRTVYDQVVAFLEALDGITTAVAGAAERRLLEVLGWLWDTLASPVLEQLHLTGRPARGGRLPRVWWCTSGLLSFLPVHAAGRHDSRFDAHPSTVLDRVISSYTPTVRALAHARRTGPAGAGDRVRLGGGRLVAVAMPQTPGASDLPGALAETTALAARFPGQVDVLTGEQATRQAVLDRLPKARWAHFACHGAANLADPSQGRLLLTDQPLTVLDITRLRLDHVQLAFLSACETARPGGRLTDEAIHLASAFQLAGYRHVIATLWPINDTVACLLADEIYGALTGPTPLPPAAAVHLTVRWLRGLQPDRPSWWASHLHHGI
jgi:tetratricopeptide (TPR) repeat protein